MSQRVRHLGVMQMGKTMGALYLLLGIIILIPVWLLRSAMGKMGSAFPGLGSSFGIGMVIALPIIYGVCGFIAGIIVAWLYNVVAGWTGGVEMDLA